MGESERAEFVENYECDAMAVAEALLNRIDAMADARAKFRRSLMYSVEVIEAPDFDAASVAVDQTC